MKECDNSTPKIHISRNFLHISNNNRETSRSLTKVLQHDLDSPSRDCSRLRFVGAIALNNFSASEMSGRFDVLTV
jgi:hypothetical protein